MNLNILLNKLETESDTVNFSDVITVIDNNYHYSPTGFINGDVVNTIGTNEGSCKIFAFAKLHELNEQQTLACFGDYYRKDVLLNPDGTDHANIRNFMLTGWSGVKFEDEVLRLLK